MKKSFSDYMLEYLHCPESERDPLNVTIADKIKVKEFIQSYLGNDTGLFDHILWTGYDPLEAVKNLTPPCVIKANNAWHRMAFVRKKSDISEGLYCNIGYFLDNYRDSWEWYYKQIKPGLVIEKLMPDHHTMYRVYVFGGKAKMFFNQRFDISKNSLHHVPDNTFYYAETGTMIPVIWDGTPSHDRDFDYKLLSKWAEKVAAFPQGAPPFVRVDFYHIDNHIYFSEMTFSPDAASRHRFSPDNLDYEMGRWYEEALKK
jgi:hypothetical protein